MTDNKDNSPRVNNDNQLPTKEETSVHDGGKGQFEDIVPVGPPAPRVIQRGLEYVLLDRGTQKWVRTNVQGREILELCNGLNTVREIANIIVERYGISNEIALSSCVDFIKSAVSTGFLSRQKHKCNLNIWLNVTDSCNMHCPMCFRGDRKRSSTHSSMSATQWERVLDELSDLPQIMVTISGGEPMLYPDIEPLVDMLRSKSNVAKITLLTNGTAVPPATYLKLAPKVSLLQISLDGATAETNDYIRGEGSFERVMSLISELDRTEINNYMLAFCAMAHNHKEMPAILELAFDHKAYGLHINKVVEDGRAMQNFDQLRVTSKDFNESLAKTIQEYRDIIGSRYKYDIPWDADHPSLMLDIACRGLNSVAFPERRTNCGLGTSMMSISYCGDVSPCSSLDTPAFIFGNVHDEGIQRIWCRMSMAMRKVTVEEVPSCEGCKVQFLCASGCRARSYNATGDIMGKDSECDPDAIENLLFTLTPVSYSPQTMIKEYIRSDVADVFGGHSQMENLMKAISSDLADKEASVKTV